MAIVNERATPFDAAANNLGLTITYVPALGLKGREQYLGTVHVEDLTTQRGAEVPIHSAIDAQVELGHNQVICNRCGCKRGIRVSTLMARSMNFADPVWKLQVKGEVELQEVEALSDVPGLNHGPGAA